MRFDPVFDAVYLLGSLWGGLPTPQVCPARPVQVAAAREAGAPVPQPTVGVTAFVDVNVVPMDAERVLANQTVVVENGRITALGPSREVTVPASAIRVDGRGQYLMPGLADMHVHLQDLMSSDSAARRALFLFVAHGVTTLRNMDHHRLGRTDHPVLQWRRQAAAGTLLSPRIYTSGEWGPDHYTGLARSKRGGARQDTPRTPAPRLDSVAAYLTAYQAVGYDFVKPYLEWRPVFDSVLAAARRLSLPVAGHIPYRDTSITLEHVLASGAYASIEHLMGYFRSLRRPQPTAPRPSAAEELDLFLAWERAQLDTTKIPELAAATARAGVWNTPTLFVMEQKVRALAHLVAQSKGRRPMAPPFEAMTGFTFSPAIMDVHRQLVKALRDAGAGLLLGADTRMGVHAAGRVTRELPGFAVHQELAALVRAGLTPYQALATGTRNAARYFGTLDSTGTVAVGKRADLVLLSGNPLRDLRHAREPAGVMLAGRWFDRAELDRRLLPAAAEPQLLLDDGLFGVLAPQLTGAQRTAIEELKGAHAAQHTALTDSLALGLGAQTGSERQRLSQLLATQLGEQRTVLTPEQRELFDPWARAWLREQARQGYQVTIPGVAPR